VHAVIVAGGIPAREDPLYPAAGGGPKATIELSGKPMVQWVVDALEASSEVEALFIVGLDESSGVQTGKPLAFVPDQKGLLANSKSGLAHVRAVDSMAAQALIVSGDIPTLTPEIVDWRVRSADPSADFDYIVIERQHMEARFPQSRRTYVRFRELEVCGGDINVVRIDLATDDELWERVLAARKNAWRAAALMGWDTVLRLLLGRLTIDDAARRASRRLDIRARVHLCPYAEAGMDVDKPSQLELLRNELSRGPGGAFPA
jgi:GTP:adenosylcobinamide-phosphate guanylyltransferase